MLKGLSDPSVLRTITFNDVAEIYLKSATPSVGVIFSWKIYFVRGFVVSSTIVSKISGSSTTPSSSLSKNVISIFLLST